MLYDVIKSKHLKNVPPQKHVCTESAVLNELKGNQKALTGDEEALKSNKEALRGEEETLEGNGTTLEGGEEERLRASTMG